MQRSFLTTFLICSVAILAPTLSSPSQNGQAPVRYVDVTATSGLHFLHRNSATPSKFLIETMTGGVALFDYDNDGWLDVFFVNGAKLKENQTDTEPLEKPGPEFWNRLFRNNHDGTFTDVTAKAGLQGKGYGMGAATGDYDNDGDTDLFVTSYGSAVLYRNNGDGTFSDVTAESKLTAQGFLTSAGFLDYDHDGTSTCSFAAICNGALLQTSIAATRARMAGPIAIRITSSRFRISCSATMATALLRTPRFRARSEKAPGKSLGLAFADFNNDGLIDINVANDSYQQFLFKNLGKGVFQEMGVIAGTGYTEDGKSFAGMGTDFADIDDDGFPDIVTTALSNESYAYFHNNGDESFTYATLVSSFGELTRLLAGWGMRIFDYDNDGAKDLFLANSHVMDNIEKTQPHLRYLQKPLLLKHNGKKFQDVSAASGEVFQKVWASRGASFGDLDNDGDIDIVVSNCNGPAYVIRNEGGNRNHWIGLELQGKKSNRDGIGARVKLV